MKKLLSVFLILVISLGSFGLPAASAVLKVGDYLGDVLYSDIAAYIHGYAIPTSVIKGKTLVVVEDLARYGFDVRWNGATKSLRVEPNENKPIAPLYVERNNKPVGTVKSKYLYTDIKTYLSDELVESFAINGVTLIDFELLAKYGSIQWNGKTRELRFIIPVESVKFGVTQKTINRGETLDLNPTVLPSNATNKKLTYKTSNPNVATVSVYGEIYAKNAGTAVITGVSDNGIQASCEVTVVVPVSAIYVETDRYSGRYKTGETASFKITVYPEDATDKSYTVNVTGNAELWGGNKILCSGSSGEATITATASSNGVSGKTEIEVIDLNEYSTEVLRLTNIERRNAGLSDLSTASTLTKAGFVRAEELISFYSHNRPNGRNCFSVFDENGVSYWAAGENIAMRQVTPEGVIEEWMNSPEHKANILNANFSRLGAGVAMDSNGTLYWTQLFTN